MNNWENKKNVEDYVLNIAAFYGIKGRNFLRIEIVYWLYYSEKLRRKVMDDKVI